MAWVEFAPALGLFAISHRIPALMGIKAPLTTALGPPGYMAPFSLISTALLFGSFALFSLAGMGLVERRRARTMGQTDWHHQTAHGSLVPFAALPSGRWHPRARPSVWRAGLWLVVWAGLWLLRTPVIDVTPAP